MFTYVLLLESDKYYVGITKDLEKRFKQNFNSNGSAWTKKYSPIQIIEFIAGNLEDSLTIEYMNQFGIENVRGGAFIRIKLPEHQLKTLQDILDSENGNCFICHQPDHYANKCPNKNKTNNPIQYYENESDLESEEIDQEYCSRCARIGHVFQNCFAKRDLYGFYLNS